MKFIRKVGLNAKNKMQSFDKDQGSQEVTMSEKKEKSGDTVDQEWCPMKSENFIKE